MSTYQPPGGQPPEGTPAYAQPQDPWASGPDHGLASVPTDPIPQQYDPYAHGVAGDQLWSQETVAHGGQPYGYVPQPPQRGKAGLIAAVFVTVLVLGGGGGFAAWYFTTQRNQTPDPTQPSASAQVTATTGAATPAASFDPHSINEGDCIVNKGTLTKPMVEISTCSPGSFKVIKKLEGAGIKENAKGLFDAETTSVAACGGTGFESWYGYKHPSDEAKDAFFCLTDNK